jgi:hypothetical protein
VLVVRVRSLLVWRKRRCMHVITGWSRKWTEERVEPINIAVLLYPRSNHNTKSPANCLILYRLFVFRTAVLERKLCHGPSSCHAFFSGVALSENMGRDIAQAVSRWVPTAAARVRARVTSYGICGGQSGTGVVFSEYFGFPCQSSFHQLLHNHHHHLGLVR